MFYIIGVEYHKSMTALVNQAIVEFLVKHKKEEKYEESINTKI